LHPPDSKSEIEDPQSDVLSCVSILQSFLLDTTERGANMRFGCDHGAAKIETL